MNIIDKIFPEYAQRRNNNECVFCSTPINEDEFRDDLSRTEYEISGMCQDCQDEIFEE